MSLKVSQEEKLYLQTKHLAGELSVLMEQVKRIQRLSDKIEQEIEFEKFDNKIQRNIQRLQTFTPVLSQVGLLILTTYFPTLFLLEDMSSFLLLSYKGSTKGVSDL